MSDTPILIYKVSHSGEAYPQIIFHNGVTRQLSKGKLRNEVKGFSQVLSGFEKAFMPSLDELAQKYPCPKELIAKVME